MTGADVWIGVSGTPPDSEEASVPASVWAKPVEMLENSIATAKIPERPVLKLILVTSKVIRAHDGEDALGKFPHSFSDSLMKSGTKSIKY